MSEAKQIKLARPAASLILSLGNEPQNCHKYLTLVRKPHMSFANSLVFPGGVCEDIDDKYLNSNSFQIYSKITAIRETAQQTGILLLPPQIPFNSLEEFKVHYKIKAFKPIEEFISRIWSSHLELIRPILRLVTPHINKMRRYDCIFYILDKNVKKINLGSSESLQNLDIDIAESKQYFWKEPSEYISMLLQGNIDMPPPQRVIFSALEHLKQMNLSTEQFFNDQALHIQPLLFQFGPQYELVVAGDRDYKLDQVLSNEPQSKTSQQLRTFFQRYLLPRTQPKAQRKVVISRSPTNLRAFFVYSGSLPQSTFMKYLPRVKPSL